MNDGGTAFPQCKLGWNDHGSYVELIDGGMSLRDWFAGMALSRIAGGCNGKTGAAPLIKEVAEECYYYADAMLKAREVPQ